ncbi:DUF3515 domain-containing protein [Microbacterium aerolatum]|uniref:Lipoprotein n=1 Tax=Microbacterium aerolatum TaxID=153731 RepID=A0A511ACM1_9MICO|nr:DUF3515 family protein [Microbacterium aerolatum]MCK3768286.1 DUF3515 domain-containing protein [Microbacterium aerolatum]GEK85915.1 hypothetical protein MAE01_10910 [Microbacterium aerolatum]GGB28330.1 hypothetical protein GCM10007198_18500 [Microbacterium aerolatum]
MSRRLATAALLLLGTALLGGCSTTVHMEPAADANNPLCADVTVGLRNADSIAGLDRRWTDAQATAAWGEPGADSAILLRCGVTVPGPTAELQCVTLEGVDWLVDATETPYLRLTTYGRDPAVQLYIDTGAVSSNDVISSRGLVGAVTSVPADGRCTTPDELDEDLQELLD